MPEVYFNLIHCISRKFSDISEKEYMDLMKEWVKYSIENDFEDIS